MRDRRALLLCFLLAGCSRDLWVTPDQRGRRAMAAGDPAAAAEEFEDPMWRGVALYRAKLFKEATAAFGRTRTAEGAYDRGNALVFIGEYEDAVASYDRALELRPEWKEAEQNRALAQLRLERLAPPEDDAGGTGGMLEADEIVIGDRPDNSSGEQVEVGEGEELSQEELRALWLRRVETKPADFLRAKFAYQLAARAAAGESGGPKGTGGSSETGRDSGAEGNR